MPIVLISASLLNRVTAKDGRILRDRRAARSTDFQRWVTNTANARLLTSQAQYHDTP